MNASIASREIRQAFEAAIADDRDNAWSRGKSDKVIRRQATLLMKQVEVVIENLPDQSMTVLELYEEIAGTAWREPE